MAIIVSKQGRNARRIEPMPIAREDYLQQYIHENPEAIPVTELKDDAKLLILAREFPTNSGPIDAIGVDSDGDVYIVETKLYKNSDKRLVIAQMLDYGAALWKGYQDFSTFATQVEATGGSKLKTGLARTLTDFFDLDEQTVEPIIQNMRSSIAEGRFQFIVLMDHLADRLRTLISFVNANSNFRILGCELEFYEHDGFEILIPKLYGAESPTKTTSSANRGVLGAHDAQDIADANGVGELWEHSVAALSECFEKRCGLSKALSFSGRIESENISNGTIMNLYPDKSSPSQGVWYGSYIWRFAEYFNVPKQELQDVLPGFDGDANNPEWDDTPYEGFIKNQDDLNRLVSRIHKTEEI